MYRTEITVKHEGDGDKNCNWRAKNITQRLEKEKGGTGYQRKNLHDTDHSTVKIG